MNIKWVVPLYVGKAAEKEKGKIVRGIKRAKAPVDGFVLILRTEGSDQLDIVPAAELQLPIYKDADIIIVGIARGKADALELTARMAKEALLHTGSADIRRYLAERERKSI